MSNRINCLIAGVGGQGTVLASKLLAGAAISNNLEARTAETIGMAQRGGSVTSHVRMGAHIDSPLIPLKSADLILAFEPAEAVRSLPYLAPDGLVIACETPINPVTSSLEGGYNISAILEFLKQNIKNLIIVKSGDLVPPGQEKALNIALLGIAAESNILPFPKELLINTIHERLAPKFIDMNRQAFARGSQYYINYKQK